MFLPFRDLGLIVVDEEHDSSYKQEEGGPLQRARHGGAAGVLERGAGGLASATPSLETWANAEAGKYARLDLTARFGEAVLPQMRAIDMRSEDLPGQAWISPTCNRRSRRGCARASSRCCSSNRRGYAPVTLCRACGRRWGCDHCDARNGGTPVPETAGVPPVRRDQALARGLPRLRVEGKMAAVGPGVERIAEEAARVFPDAKLAILSSDLFGSARALKRRSRRSRAARPISSSARSWWPRGTIFPRLTLVGVIDADLGLQGSDLRAAETHVPADAAGFGARGAGGNVPGVALMQTFQPEHPVIRAILSGGRGRLLAGRGRRARGGGDAALRASGGIIISAEDAAAAFDLGTRLARQWTGRSATRGGIVYGPPPAPIARVRGRHRSAALW